MSGSIVMTKTMTVDMGMDTDMTMTGITTTE